MPKLLTNTIHKYPSVRTTCLFVFDIFAIAIASYLLLPITIFFFLVTLHR